MTLQPLSFYTANLLWCAASLPAAWGFDWAERNTRAAQEAILFSFLRRNAHSAYGQAHAFGEIRTLEQFRERTPIVAYDDLQPWIERICQGEPNVLTCEPVLMLETTSGSSGAVKYVPYTASLRREVQHAVGAWLADLFLHRPQILGGPQYWSISPATRDKQRTAGGLPIGFDDDVAYLGAIEQFVARRVMAAPSSLRRIADIDALRRATMEQLMRQPRLRLISVWHPSFLTLLMQHLPTGAEPRRLWPDLQLISCWTSGAAARFLPELRALFPGVEIQGKGLLATEGVVSIPLSGRKAAAPAVTSHFLEFLDEAGRPHLADELQIGRRYEVLLTTGGGFVRYRLGDTVEVVAERALEFVGRGQRVSDICGEKLSEPFVASVLAQAAQAEQLPGLLMLAPEWGEPPRYLLISEQPVPPPLAAEVERLLRTSVHYDYCRKLGQLAPLEACFIPHAGRQYLEACRRRGQKAGDIKPAALLSEFGWRERLLGFAEA